MLALRSPARTALRRFARHRIALVGLVVLVLAVLAAVFAGVLSGHDPNRINLSGVRQPPSAEHWLGTDDSGRDVFSRLLHAGRVSLAVGFSAAVVACLIGTLLGALAGVLGGWVDSVIMRMADIFLSLPVLIVLIVIAGILGPSAVSMVVLFGVFAWPTSGRIVRGITLSIRELEFFQASRAFGARTGWLMRHHVLPAVLGAVVVVATLEVAQAILLEAALSFLGLGIQPPQASWGNMLNDAQRLSVISQMPWLWVPPGVAVALTVLSVNFVGDGLRDAFDPREAR
ncbi:ABC transporter permease [Micromonospora sp. DR5-3]|uniref:oligopeptide ABC transporter permease n=1 Tax=unclassified Micromonospora TaxID=2617518 RepID=UPI0011DC69E5|nr:MULTISPECIES: oligopeptide ABC transporter permease [unclassified Micromonospora]MCW3818898.1 ABC transporter permease [Micromonospora sp. DR5-3]TYC20924.1 ABC transporter permease [Micromonospora sp. MP36]